MSHTASNARGVTAGKMGHNSSTINEYYHLVPSDIKFCKRIRNLKNYKFASMIMTGLLF